MTHSERAVRRRRIADMVAGGAAPTEACAAYSVCLATIKAACAEHGIAWPAQPRPARSAAATLGVLADLLNTDDRVEDIARRRGLPMSGVYERMAAAREAGIKVRKRRRRA